MKHEKLIAAWDSILPDAAADERMRSEIMAYQRTYRQKDRSIFLGRYVPAAACLVLVLAAAVWFGLRRPQTYTVTLENGQTLVYETGSETARSQADADYGNTKSRPLTGAELYTLFPAVSGSAGDAADAIFRAETGALIHAEGTVSPMRDCLRRIRLLPAGSTPLSSKAFPSGRAALSQSQTVRVSGPRSSMRRSGRIRRRSMQSLPEQSRTAKRSVRSCPTRCTAW